MKTFSRTYHTLKFFRGERREAELDKLSEEERDFEYRRLLIEEREKDLHVAFSKGEIFEKLSWGFLASCAFFLPYNLLLAEIVFGISIVLQCLSKYNKRKYRKILKRYHFTMLLVSNVIENTYGISLPTYL